MFFNSLSYFIFLPVVLVLYYIVPTKIRWALLLTASMVFYAFLDAPYLIFILLLVIANTYFFGIIIHNNNDNKKKNIFFWIGVTICLLIMIGARYFDYFKNIFYLNLFNGMTNKHLYQYSPILSIGISFYVFQAISYLIDVYTGIEKPERHIGYFALYMCFFAKLLQGPIERSNELLPQLKSQLKFDFRYIESGFFLFTWGLFKKVVVADRLSLYVDAVYNNVHSYSGLSLIVATYYYAIQLYCDFSGYTDMALGSARMFGIHLTQNFKNPYLATSIADFWRRWHISLSRWILDYLFKPMQMVFRDYKDKGTAFALLLTFIACGAWHGVSFGFIIWGFLHGLYMAISIYYKPVEVKFFNKLGLNKSVLIKYFQIFITFNMVSFSWIFFRSNNISDAYYIVIHLFSDLNLNYINITSLNLKEFLNSSIIFNLSRREYMVIIFGIFMILLIHTIKYFSNIKNIDCFLAKAPFWLKWSACYVLLVFIIMLGYDKESYFIYFQF